MGTSILDLKTGSCIFRPSLILPKSGGYGRLYNWYAASSRSYGLLYNWYAATDLRNIAPVGWHVPSKEEFDTLITYLGGSSVAGGKLKENGTAYWQSPNTGANNSSGFNAIASSERNGNGLWGGLKTNAEFITTSLNGIYVYYNFATYNNSSFTTSMAYKNSGLAVRLIKDDSNDTAVMTDNDGYKYPTVKIGNQVWMAQNLQSIKYRDGSIIPNVTNETEWAALSTGACCWYNNTKTYDSAPAGWHLPNVTEYDTSVTYLGGESVAGAKLKETGITHWNTPNTGATNISGITLLGSGVRDSTSGSIFSSIKSNSVTWSNQQFDLSGSMMYVLSCSSSSSEASTTGIFMIRSGLSIRFIRNSNNTETTITDNNGNIYESITVGTQTWLKQNWKSKKYRDGTPISFAGTNGINYTNAEWGMLNTPAVCAYNNDENLV